METLGLIDLAGFVALLLWGLHMVQAGIMAAFGARLRTFFQYGLKNRFSAFSAGAASTAVLQSSTATALILAGFTAAGTIELGSALAVMLGANVGTTLIVQVLAFDMSVVAPVLILLGVLLNAFGQTDRLKNVGKAGIGLGLMLFALTHMVSLLSRAATSPAFQALIDVVASDLFLAVVLGALLAWAMHSSVAVVLLIMSFASQGLMPLPAAFALVLGANLGSAVNPLLNMLAQKDRSALRLPIGNLAGRAIGLLIVFPCLGLIKQIPGLSELTPHSVANFHLAFNLITAVVFIPFLGPISKALSRALPATVKFDPAAPKYLDPDLVRTPSLAIAAAAREVMRMAEVAEIMLTWASIAYKDGGQGRIDAVRKTDDTLDGLNRHLKSYLTAIPANTLTDTDRQRLDQVLYASITFEQIGDVISNNLARRAGISLQRQQTVSRESWQNMEPLFDRVIGNIKLAATVLLSSERKAAKRLFNEHRKLEALERLASQIHLDRLRAGSVEGLETSALEIDTLHDLRQINHQLVSIARVVFERDEGAKPRPKRPIKTPQADTKRSMLKRSATTGT